MFAFALWDDRSRRLLLARDRVGQEAALLRHGRRAARSSPPSSRRCSRTPALKRAVDLEALDDYLSFGAVPAPRRSSRAWRSCPPAHYLVWEHGADPGHRVLGCARMGADSRSDGGAGPRGARAVFDDAVRLRLVSDVPLGAFLSGGVDSTAVVEAMARLSERPVRHHQRSASLSAAFNELPHARAVAEALGTDHHEVLVRGEGGRDPAAAGLAPRRAVRRLVRAADLLRRQGGAGAGDGGALGRRRATRSSRATSGATAESLGGRESAGSAARVGSAWRAGPARPRLSQGGLAAPARSAAATSCRTSAPRFERAYFARSVACCPPDKAGAPRRPSSAASSRGHDSFAGVRASLRPRAAGLDPLSRLLYVDFKTWLANDILVKVDRMSMANSLEVRAPLLDHKVIEFAATVPSDLKYRGRTSKYLLKRHLEGRVPRSAVHRPEAGLRDPPGRGGCAATCGRWRTTCSSRPARSGAAMFAPERRPLALGSAISEGCGNHAPPALGAHDARALAPHVHRSSQASGRMSRELASSRSGGRASSASPAPTPTRPSISGWSDAGLRRRVALFAALLTGPAPAGARVALELGCGGGTYVRLLAGLGYRAVGLDYSVPSLAARDRRRPGRKGPLPRG